MYIGQLLVVMVITSVIMAGGRFNTSKMLSYFKTKEDTYKIERIKKAALDYYNVNGKIPTNIFDIGGSTDRSNFLPADAIHDRNKELFVILTDNNNTFSYNGGGSDYLLAVVQKGYNKVLDSKIESGALVVGEDDNVFLISKYAFEDTRRGQTDIKVSSCNTAVLLYNNDNGSYPSDVFQLTSSGYLAPLNAYDNFGTILKITNNDHKCYSFGKNKIDDNQTNDDIVG